MKMIGSVLPRFDQFFLEFEAAEARHADIEHETAGALLPNLLEKFITGFEDLVIEID